MSKQFQGYRARARAFAFFPLRLTISRLPEVFHDPRCYMAALFRAFTRSLAPEHVLVLCAGHGSSAQGSLCRPCFLC